MGQEYSSYLVRLARFIKAQATLGDASNRRRLPVQFRKDTTGLRTEYVKQVVPMRRASRDWVQEPLVFSTWTESLEDIIHELGAEVFTLDEYIEALIYSVAF